MSIQYRTLAAIHFGEYARLDNLQSLCAGHTVIDFDLQLAENLTLNQMSLLFNYRIGLFDETEVRRIVDKYMTIARQLISQPN
uniref:hypothetical protein n=1 Tax=Paenibacillus sp. FSL L8-0158 TaxID=2954752 RepID=UPI00406D0E85